MKTFTEIEHDNRKHRQRDIEREIEQYAEMFVRRPNRNGWWLWHEGGRGRKTELVLLVGDGRTVASDDEYTEATGEVQKSHAQTFNYWEGTETSQKMMPGDWLFLG